MTKLFASLTLVCATAFGQYKMEPAGPPPSDVPAAIRDTLQKDGAKISGPSGAYADVWLRSAVPSGPATSEASVTLQSIPHGTLLGVIRFNTKAMDRRGQPIKPGLYTMRLSYHPVDGAHQGVAPQRDFACLVPAAGDTDANSTPNYQQVVKMSEKASGTAHPAILSIWKEDNADAAGTLTQDGDDWTLHSRIGDTPVALIVFGVKAG